LSRSARAHPRLLHRPRSRLFLYIFLFTSCHRPSPGCLCARSCAIKARHSPPPPTRPPTEQMVPLWQRRRRKRRRRAREGRKGSWARLLQRLLLSRRCVQAQEMAAREGREGSCSMVTSSSSWSSLRWWKSSLSTATLSSRSSSARMRHTQSSRYTHTGNCCACARIRTQLNRWQRLPGVFADTAPNACVCMCVYVAH
jgi:hypothetical protein